MTFIEKKNNNSGKQFRSKAVQGVKDRNRVSLEDEIEIYIAIPVTKNNTDIEFNKIFGFTLQFIELFAIVDQSITHFG
jgi:hypothetical protein